MIIKEVEELKTLDFNKQATFAYLTCERLFPNYVYFSNNYSFGNPKELRKAVDCLSYAGLEPDLNNVDINKLIKDIEKNTPDTEDFTTPFVSSALDACSVILDSLHFLLDKNFQRIKNISSYATDTISMYIQDVENLDYNSDPDFQAKIDSHPLMKREADLQSGIISFLHKAKQLDTEDIKTLLLLQENNKKGSLDL